MADADLVRFLDAQCGFYDQVTDELTKGRKRSHWMWFIFPQLAGLGHSSMAERYAIRDLTRLRDTWRTRFSGADCATMCG